jgi:hypothetical protein
MNRTELVRLARLGAAARIAELQREIDSLRRQFPGLGRSSELNVGDTAGTAFRRGARKTEKKRGRPRGRRMSVQAREKIRQAQLKRWAKVRASGKKK